MSLKALSPVDGRYAGKVDALRNICSEYGLIRYRVLVEVRWLQWLSDEPSIKELAPFSMLMKSVLNRIVDEFSFDDARIAPQHMTRCPEPSWPSAMNQVHPSRSPQQLHCGDCHQCSDDEEDGIEENGLHRSRDSHGA